MAGGCKLSVELSLLGVSMGFSSGCFGWSLEKCSHWRARFLSVQWSVE